MIFLHPWMLFAGTAVAVPIVIHLLNRRSAKTVDWGAMHFLLGSLVSRKRRVLLDEILLLACRCLLIALVVTAIARPVIPAGSSIAWAVVLPILLVGAVALGVGTAVWQQRRWRWICYGTGAGLLSLALLAIALEHWLRLGMLMGQSRDVVLIIDGSSSMSLQVEGRSNFSRAVEEARDLVKSLQGSSTVSIILAGPLPQVKTPFPLSDAEPLVAVLEELKPAGGMMAVHDALRTGSLVLSMGTNARKQIVLITDGHKAGWDVSDRDRWETTSLEIQSAGGVEPEFFCRLFDMPSTVRNVTVTEVSCARRVVGTDRPVPIRAQVANTGQTPVSASAAYLWIDGKQVDRRPVSQLEPRSSETLGFSYRFDSPGAHVIEVKADVEDQLPDDNRRAHVVYVAQRLPVLIVNGHSGGRLLDRASGFLQLALDPGSVSASRDGAAREAKDRGLVEVTVIDPWRAREVRDWDQYRVVILADVADLPHEVAPKVASFVARGGGLLVAPGEKSSPAFYNGWMATVGDEQQRMLPVSLRKRVTIAQDKEPLQLAVATLTHPALQSLREAKKNDLDTSRINSHWLFETAPGARQVLIAGKLSDGSPWLAEHLVGRGKVLVTATALDVRDSNLPTRQSFLPLVHGMVYHLSEDAHWELNQKPSRQLLLRFPGAVVGSALPAESPAPAAPLHAEVIGPDNARLDAVGRFEQGSLVVQVDQVAVPGLYRLKLPAADSGAPAEKATVIPFSVAADPGESTLERLSESELKSLQDWAKLQPLLHREDLEAVGAGRTHGMELWKSLMFLAFLVVVAEVGLTWWVGLQRIPPEKEMFDFASRATTANFREQLEKVRAGQASVPVTMAYRNPIEAKG